MKQDKKFLIIDGYAKKSRDEFDVAGMKIAGKLYEDMVNFHAPNAKSDIFFPSDPDASLPAELDSYDAVLWTGCNLTVYKTDDPRVIRMRELCGTLFDKKIPMFGSCWAAQIAVAIAGGEVSPHPRGREIGIARKIALTEEGKNHPMYRGKVEVFDAFISHDDEITKMPPNSKLLAGNEWSKVQAVEVNFKGTSFWATQYHVEYNLHEVARLFVARQEKMFKWGYFQNESDLQAHVDDYEALWEDPKRKDLSWKLAAGDELINQDIRELEFRNWLEYTFER